MGIRGREMGKAGAKIKKNYSFLPYKGLGSEHE